MSRLLLIATLVAGVATAHADIWTRAIETTDATKDRYEQAIREGDELAMQANARGLSRTRVTSLVDTALRAYAEASVARPRDPEPYHRAASVLEAFFIDCDRSLGPGPPTCPPRGQLDLARGRQTVEAWDAFEARAPLDPRVSEVLFARAILRTKLVETSKSARAHLEGAARDYQALLDRADGLTGLRLEQVWGNLAETYMMLGRLDEAIDAYQVAIDQGGNHSTYYGKAVALDRDERGAEALEQIRRLGPRAFEVFKNEIAEGMVFFVPPGEEQYYFALIYEALGDPDAAVVHWKRFLASGAHPEYQPRAKVHLDAQLKQQRTRPRPVRRGLVDD